MKCLSLNNILRAVDGAYIGDPSGFDGCIKRVVTDSRTVNEGDLYIPIIGEKFDGHGFIEEAFVRGALLAFTSKAVEAREDRLLIKVKDTRLALGHLAGYYRSLFHIPVIGVTGSVGKTSTKEMMAAILGTKFKVLKTSGNYNNDIGLPLTLFGLEQTHEVAVVELGMNHFGEIDYLANILKPTIGIISNIGVSHIEFLGSREGILKAKTEMLPHIEVGGTLILNGDDDLLIGVLDTVGIRTLFYGSDGRFDCTLVKHQVLDTGGQKITVTTKAHSYDVEVAYPGEHVLHNALGCILAAETLGVDKKSIIDGIKAYEPAGMRLNAYELGQHMTILDDAYNASVDSMGSALKTLKSMQANYSKSIAVLGSMFEMGSYSEEGHRLVGSYVAAYVPDLLLTVGEAGRWIGEGAVAAGYDQMKVVHYDAQEALIAAIKDYIEVGTILLLKASRGMHLEKTRDYLLESFEGIQ